MKKSYHIIIVGAVFIIGLIIGSFLDLKINSSIFSDRNMAGLIIALLGILPGYSLLALFSGFLFENELKIKHPMPYRVFVFILALVGYGLSIYSFGKEVFSVNCFNVKKVFYLGFVIALVWMSGCAYLGYFLGKKYSNENTWKIIITAFAVAAVALGLVLIIKPIFDRPRFRIAVLNNEDYFRNWWQIYDGPKAYAKEEFKSFPSGHTCGAAISMVFLPYLGLLIEPLKKHRLTFFYSAFALTLLVAFVRMWVGAHFLSDVSMGAILLVACYFLGNHFLLHKTFKLTE